MSLLRKTSTYLVEVASSDPSGTLEKMLQACSKEVVASGTYRARAQVRFRCESDDHVALNAALQMASGAQFLLTTGYGINQREVAQ